MAAPIPLLAPVISTVRGFQPWSPSRATLEALATVAPVEPGAGCPAMTADHGLFTPRRRGLMLVMSSPSGAGKTSISRRTLELEPELTLSISVTTRPRRPAEREGVHYHFIDATEF